MYVKSRCRRREGCKGKTWVCFGLCRLRYRWGTFEESPSLWCEENGQKKKSYTRNMDLFVSSMKVRVEAMKWTAPTERRRQKRKPYVMSVLGKKWKRMSRLRKLAKVKRKRYLPHKIKGQIKLSLNTLDCALFEFLAQFLVISHFSISMLFSYLSWFIDFITQQRGPKLRSIDEVKNECPNQTKTSILFPTLHSVQQVSLTTHSEPAAVRS